MSRLRARILSFFTPTQALSPREQARSALGALIGIALASAIGWLAGSDSTELPWLVAPMGASAVLLFALPGSPLAQPWPLLGGNVLSALVGITCSHWFAEPLLAAMIAVTVAILLMFSLRCLHPPGGAVALLTALGAPGAAKYGYAFAFTPVAVNSLAMLAAAVTYNRLFGRRYPHVVPDHANTHRTRDARPSERIGVAPEDLDAVMREYNEVLDISRDDLEEIIRRTEMHAYQRHFGRVTCADIMSKDLVKVEAGTDLNTAWRLLEKHKVTALPVVNRFERVIGIVTMHDFLKLAGPRAIGDMPQRLLQLFSKTSGLFAKKPTVVAEIMVIEVRTVRADQSIAEIIPLFSDLGLHHVPVLDANERLVGMLTQADVISALYRASLEPGSRFDRAA